MQICTRCQNSNTDDAVHCEKCGADLKEFSHYAVALKKLRQNPRVKNVRISVYDDACPSCQQLRGTYPLEFAPELPVKGCSHPLGCRCFYEPWLESLLP